jgi:tRNA nucleotidyltransferase/poly(A) polymerase
MFEVLRECGALAVVLPELDRLWGVPQRADYHPEVDTGVHLMMVLDMAARLQAPLAVRFACLAHDLGKGTTPPMCCRATSATSSAAPSCCKAVRAPARAHGLPRAGRRGGARARQHPPQRRPGRRRAGAPAGALRRDPQARSGSTRSCWPASATRAGAWV